MPVVFKTCKVCKKQYQACNTPNWGVWRWQDVACCYEHGQEYLTKVLSARKKPDTDDVNMGEAE